jgi:hypothetical protein
MVDKGNTTVIMNTLDYESKLQDLLSSSFYKPLAKNPLNTITSLVTQAIKSSSLDPNIQKQLIPHNPKISLFTKIHVTEALDPISKMVDLETPKLIEICPTSTFFTFKGTCYE